MHTRYNHILINNVCWGRYYKNNFICIKSNGITIMDIQAILNNQKNKFEEYALRIHKKYYNCNALIRMQPFINKKITIDATYNDHNMNIYIDYEDDRIVICNEIKYDHLFIAMSCDETMYKIVHHNYVIDYDDIQNMHGTTITINNEFGNAEEKLVLNFIGKIVYYIDEFGHKYIYSRF